MNATGPNGPIGMDASHSDGSEGVSFSWDDGVVDEGSYESEENSSDSNWLGGGHMLSDDDDDDDDEEEITSIKKIEQLNEVHGNEADGNEVDGNEKDGNEEARDEQHENGADENEADLVGVCSGEETKYLDFADVGSYETYSDGDVISKKTGQVFFDSSTAHPRFEVGMIFENLQQFKEALYAYAVGNRFDFKFVSNKKEKVRVACKGKGCPFVVHASRDKSDGCFKVKTLVTDHNCSVTFKNSRTNFKFLGKHFISKLRILPTLRSVQMIKLGREELNVELNKKLCFRARKWALEKIRGSVVHEFHRLWDYVNTLRAADVRVVEVENRETWAWFLNNLQHDIGFGDGDGCTLLSEMQKVENHGPSPTLSAPPSSQTSHVPPSSQIPSPPSSQTSHVPPFSQISSPPSSQTSHVPPSQIPSAPQSAPQSTSTMVFMRTPSIQQLSELGRPSQVLLSRPHTRSFTKPTSQPTSTTATSPVAAPVLLSRPHTRSLTKPTSQPTSTTATPSVVAPVSASSRSDATATVSSQARLPKLTIMRHPPKN
ncbi:hypothetical protein V6N11_018970 [Hibiscus sabdariffa]|uniref:Transposase MuDR plant domain-containing protein n=1 Tax=Hibiscus sabdariffa TaxID=183260 RepID=A0ABR2R1F0_9ROSI